MQVKQRLRINTAVMALSVIALIAVLIVTAQRVSRVMEQKQIADALITASFERLALRTDYMLTSGERAREQVRAKNEQVGELLKSAAEKFTDTGDKKMISALIEGHESIGKIFRSIVANRQHTAPKGRNAALSEEIEDRLLSQLNMRAYEAVSISSKLQNSSSAALVSSLRFGGGWIAFVLLLIGAATLINSLLLNRTIASRIEGLYDGASALGRGNLEHRIDLPGDDEFTSLAGSFNEMAAKLSGTYHELENELLERKWAEERLAADFDAMTRLHKLGTLFVQEGNLEPVLNEIVDAAIAISDADFGNIQLLDPKSSVLKIAAHRGFPQWWLDFWNSVAAGQGVCGTALARQERVVIEDVEQSPVFVGTPALEMQLKAGVRAVQSTPLLSRSGKLLGMFSTHYKTPHRPNDRSLRLLDLLARHAADIIERAQAEEELRKIQERLESHMTNSPLAIIEFDHSYRVVRWSGDAERIFGWKADEIVGKPISGIRWVYEEDIRSVVQVSEDMSTGRRPRNLNVNRNYRKDGSIIHCEWYNSAIYDEQGRMTSVLSQVLDITERTRAEEALKESERRYHSLFENMTEGFAFCKMLFDDNDRSADFIYLKVNSSFRKITGLENVVGKKVTEVIPRIKESHPELFDIYGRVALTGKPERFEIEFKPLGMWLSVSVYSIEKGYFVAVFDDITERKKAEAEILKLSEDMAARNVELEGVNSELEAFIYSISHDLRAPVRTMAGFARFLAEDYGDKLDEQAKDYLRRITLGSEKMTLLINDLLRLSKISRQEFDRMDIDLSKLASSVISGFRASDPGRSVEVSIAEGLTAFADLRLMEIVLSNLLGNAWKFTSKTGKAQIEFGARQTEGDATYFVRDNGAGFNPEYMEKMFWPFQRLHTEEDFEGTGIGLTIVERIIRRHGGKVWAEGEVGKGATVYFTLGQNRV